jgi:hypothetical protein
MVIFEEAVDALDVEHYDSFKLLADFDGLGVRAFSFIYYLSLAGRRFDWSSLQEL